MMASELTSLEIEQPILLRPSTMEDIPALQQLIALSARGLSGSYYSPEQIEDALVYIFGVDTQLILDGTFFVAEAAGQIVGCGGWSRRQTLCGGDQMKADPTDPPLDPASDPARIRAFFVHPDWARRGIGRSILSASEEAAQDTGFARLELVATLPGEPLYAAFGYTVIERVEVPMGDGPPLPCVRMGKRLP